MPSDGKLTGVSVPEEAIEAATDALCERVDADRGYLHADAEAALRAAAPLILAAELERLADEIEAVSDPDPAGDMWLKAEAAGRREVMHALRGRVGVLRGDQKA